MQQKNMVQLNRTLFRILLFVLILFIFDRAVAYMHVPKSGDTAITLYSTQWCSYCASLRMYFDTHAIDYKEFDVEKSASGVLGLWAFRARGVPLVVVGTDIIYGYDMERITAALDRLEPRLASTTISQ